MNRLDFLACPSCRSDGLQQGDCLITCPACAKAYPVFDGIPDFRDARVDSTADFTFDEDHMLARSMAAVSKRVRTFHALYAAYTVLYARYRGGDRLADFDVDAFLADSKPAETPLTDTDTIHGQAIIRKIKEHVSDAARTMPPPGLALEDGSGVGYFVDGLCERFQHLVVLDFSMAYLLLARKIAQERGRQNVTFVCGSAERLPFKSSVFDFIHSNNVIEHVADQEAMFGEAARTLATGGLLFVLSPNRFSLYLEPHFRVPMFGFIPKPLRRWLIWKVRNRDMDDIASRSLGELRAMAARRFNDVHVSFLPRHLTATVTGGRLRAFVIRSLNSRIIGGPTHLLLNKVLLGFMPYHVVLCFKPRQQPSSEVALTNARLGEMPR